VVIVVGGKFLFIWVSRRNHWPDW